MVQFLILSLLRILLTVVVLYFVITILRNFIQGLIGTPDSESAPKVKTKNSRKTVQTYTDVQDAKFSEVKNESPKSSKVE